MQHALDLILVFFGGFCACNRGIPPAVLTLRHHVYDDKLAAVCFKEVLGVVEGPDERALVSSCVVVGHIEDVD